MKIPCDDGEPYSEIDIPIETNKNGDQLLQSLRIYFNKGSIGLDSLKESASKQFSSEDVNITQATVEKMTELGSVEAFVLAHPNSSNKLCKVGLYLDEAGQLKRLAPNRRATALANTCGFNDVPLVGDMFVGRLSSNNNGQLSNVDFTLNEVDSNAVWLKDIQKLNYEHGVSTGRVAMEGSEQANRGPVTNGEDSVRGFRWNETNELMEVCVTFPPDIVKVVSKDVKVKFGSKSLRVEVSNGGARQVLLDVPLLAGAVRPDDSTWSISGRDLEISMEKVDGSSKGRWGKLES